MANERLDEIVGKKSVEVYLVPVLLVHVPRPSNLRMALAEFEGIVRVALQHKPLGVVEVNHCEYLVCHTESEGCLVEGEIFGSGRKRQAIVADRLNIHTL